MASVTVICLSHVQSIYFFHSISEIFILAVTKSIEVKQSTMRTQSLEHSLYCYFEVCAWHH